MDSTTVCTILIICTYLLCCSTGNIFDLQCCITHPQSHMLLFSSFLNKQLFLFHAECLASPCTSETIMSYFAGAGSHTRTHTAAQHANSMTTGPNPEPCLSNMSFQNRMIHVVRSVTTEQPESFPAHPSCFCHSNVASVSFLSYLSGCSLRFRGRRPADGISSTAPCWWSYTAYYIHLRRSWRTAAVCSGPEAASLASGTRCSGWPAAVGCCWGCR